MSTLVAILTFVVPAVCLLLLASLWLLNKTISDAIDPTYKLKEMSKADRQFIKELFKRIKIMRDAEEFCQVTEGGIFCELSKEEMSSKLYWRRQIKFLLTALVFGLALTFLFNSVVITFSIVGVVFYSAMIDKLFVNVMMNNLLLLKE